MKRRVVVTGLGVIAPNGVGKEEFWGAIKSGKSGITRISRFDPARLTSQCAGEVTGFDPADYIAPKRLKRMDRTSHLAVSAAKMAAKDANLDFKKEDTNRIGVILGVAVAGYGYILEQHNTFLEKGPMRINPFTVVASFSDSSSSQIAIEFNLGGPNFSVSSACSSGVDAIGYAFNAIRRDEMDMAVTGGADAPLSPGIMASFCVVRALSTNNNEPGKASRPFDRKRDGFVLGEGAGILILEELEHAKKRNAHIYAEVLGYGITCDASHITQPRLDGEAAARAIRFALKDANVKAEEINCISAHGTSTPLNDKTETMVIKKIFGNYAYKIPITALKSMIGHLIGGAGPVELIAGILSMEKGVIPPTINYEHPDPECDLDYVPNEAREAKIDTILKNSFGFGGKNSALVVRGHV